MKLYETFSVNSNSDGTINYDYDTFNEAWEHGHKMYLKDIVIVKHTVYDNEITHEVVWKK